jgi:hypothetical protein
MLPLIGNITFFGTIKKELWKIYPRIFIAFENAPDFLSGNFSKI